MVEKWGMVGNAPGIKSRIIFLVKKINKKNNTNKKLKQEQIHDCREKCGLLSYLAHFLAYFKL